MKLNSDLSLAAASNTFHRFGGSWTDVRRVARRNKDGVLVIPKDAEPKRSLED